MPLLKKQRKHYSRVEKEIKEKIIIWSSSSDPFSATGAWLQSLGIDLQVGEQDKGPTMGLLKSCTKAFEPSKSPMYALSSPNSALASPSNAPVLEQLVFEVDRFHREYKLVA
uniref:Uncharacterized protein n=1 Tax=Romanomermis culicivorax TaxID=13658 RepID=A0A915KNQ3_ROMCU